MKKEFRWKTIKLIYLTKKIERKVLKHKVKIKTLNLILDLPKPI
jgi:hypothetical protein